MNSQGERWLNEKKKGNKSHNILPAGSIVCVYVSAWTNDTVLLYFLIFIFTSSTHHFLAQWILFWRWQYHQVCSCQKLQLFETATWGRLQKWVGSHINIKIPSKSVEANVFRALLQKHCFSSVVHLHLHNSFAGVKLPILIFIKV